MKRGENSGIWLRERGMGFRTLNNDVKSEGRKVILIKKLQNLHVKQNFFWIGDDSGLYAGQPQSLNFPSIYKIHLPQPNCGWSVFPCCLDSGLGHVTCFDHVGKSYRGQFHT